MYSNQKKKLVCRKLPYFALLNLPGGAFLIPRNLCPACCSTSVSLLVTTPSMFDSRPALKPGSRLQKEQLRTKIHHEKFEKKQLKASKSNKGTNVGKPSHFGQAALIQLAAKPQSKAAFDALVTWQPASCRENILSRSTLTRHTRFVPTQLHHPTPVLEWHRT